MKFQVQYSPRISLQEEIEADSLEQAKEIASLRSKELVQSLEIANYEVVGSWDIMPLKRFSLIKEDGKLPILLLDGIPVADEQVLLIKHGKGEAGFARAYLHPKHTEWRLSRAEFVGHPYLDLCLSRDVIDADLLATEVDINDEHNSKRRRSKG